MFPRPSPRRVVAASALVAAIAILILGPIESAATNRAFAIAVLSIGLWATGVVAEHVAALIFFAAAMLLGAGPAGTVFAGFQSAALWLIISGLVMGVAVNRTGLGKRLARRMVQLFGARYGGLIAGAIAMGLALSFVMPSSMGRVVLLMPIALAMADGLGFAKGSNGHTGLVVATALGAFVPPFGLLTANVPNLVMIGASEEAFGYTPLYGTWFALHFPLLGLGKAVAIAVIILALFPDRATATPAALGEPEPMTAAERRLLVILIFALGGWATDFLHHVSPAWIGLVAAIACLMPRIGALEQADFGKINVSSIFYVAGILGLGAVMAESGVADLVARWVLDLAPLDPARPAANFAALILAGMAIALGTTLPALPAVMTPISGQLAAASGFSLEVVLMIQVLSFSVPILPYQAPPLMVTIQLGGVSLRDCAKPVLALTAISLLVLFPLDFLWWRLLGWI